MFVIVDYGVGNLSSIQNMLKKAGASSIISSRAEDLQGASKLLLPGMGAFDNCMQRLNQSGLREIIDQKALIERIPILGICVGLQMFMESSEEGKLPGLGWIAGRTVKFDKSKLEGSQKIPNMGWLEIIPMTKSKILVDLDGSRFYFAHSYHVQLMDKSDDLINAVYGYQFSAGLEHNNLLGVQFHPEKSHRFGMQLLKNFASNY
jgi:imidazole glycerol-phosphate synthase subunit HisH